MAESQLQVAVNKNLLADFDTVSHETIRNYPDPGPTPNEQRRSQRRVANHL
jgi:hypothetical protein